jgi:hypothetical protein
MVGLLTHTYPCIPPRLGRKSRAISVRRYQGGMVFVLAYSATKKGK